MNLSEKRVYERLLNNIPWVDWEFFVGNELGQAKQRPPLGLWVSYPDFEGYDKDGELIYLVELKAYEGWFYEEEGLLGLLDRQYKAYFVTQKYENIPVKIVFEICVDGEYHYYWESLNRMSTMTKRYMKRKTRYKNKENTKEIFVEFRAIDFRQDIENITN